jgi:endonuclease/exonuclease/phosphatase family metal-dependent hydrolase
MTLSILQLNICGDNYWDKLIPYLTNHTFDLIFLQELCGKKTEIGTINCQRDCFVELQKILSQTYQGELSIAETFTSSPTSYMGNAIFYNKTFELNKKKICTMHQGELMLTADTFEATGRTLLHLTLSKEKEKFSVLTTHFAWAKTPHEQPHQTKQGEILLEYLDTVPHPFILTGDFNLDPEQPLIQKIGKRAKNLTTAAQITNTINPRMHRVKGLTVAVDYIFVTEDIQVKQCSVIEEDLSDHLGLTATLTL